MSGLEDELRELNEKLEIMMKRLDYMEVLISQNKEFSQLSRVKSGLELGTSLNSEALKLIQRLISVQRRLSRKEDPKD